MRIILAIDCILGSIDDVVEVDYPTGANLVSEGKARLVDESFAGDENKSSTRNTPAKLKPGVSPKKVNSVSDNGDA